MHYTFLNKILLGKRRPSPQTALYLEKTTLISRLAWLYPEEYFNPQAPHLYKGPYPPNLAHLTGAPLDFAQEIIKAFPHSPPTWSEFKAFKKEYRKKLKNKKIKQRGSKDEEEARETRTERNFSI